MKILVTGGAGFIGSHLVKKLINQGDEIVIVDDLNDYYDPKLKKDRLEDIKKYGDFKFIEADICDLENMKDIFSDHKFEIVCHIAARAGVRSSLNEPLKYVNTNVNGTLNILECIREYPVRNFVFASSSSVYSGNKKVPFSEKDRVDNPLSPYAASKRAGELLISTYQKLYNIPTICLRFFTVYGPWGRPDMAYYDFSKKIIEGETINVYNHGKMRRDFTYIDEIIDGIIASIDKQFSFEIINLGHNSPVELKEFIAILEDLLGKKAKLNMKPMQPGEPLETYADITKAEKLLGFSTKTSIYQGLAKFVNWFKEYHKE